MFATVSDDTYSIDYIVYPDNIEVLKVNLVGSESSSDLMSWLSKQPLGYFMPFKHLDALLTEWDKLTDHLARLKDTRGDH
jgi:hypothetical protein